MLSEISIIEWTEFYNNNNLPIFYNPYYLVSVANSFDVKVNYYNYLQNEELLFCAAAFEFNSKIIVPEYFTYNPFWINPLISERKKIAIQKEFIHHLKKSFKKISFKFNIDVIDIRPFKWAGFDVDIRYTYIKDTTTTSNEKIIKNVKSAFNKGIYFKNNLPNVNTISLTTNFLKQLRYSSNLIEKYKKFLTLLSENNLLTSFEIYNQDDLIGASLCLLDHNNQKAYTLISNPIAHNYKNAHALMYEERIKWLNENKYLDVDFCGANYESISHFKSYFNPTLKPYFIVKYNGNILKINKVFTGLKSKLVNILK